MAVESDADRLLFFDTDEFGSSATYALVAGATSTVTGIFDRAAEELLEDVQGVGVIQRVPKFVMRESDLPAGYGDGDTLTVSATAYTIRAHELDGRGMASLRLEA